MITLIILAPLSLTFPITFPSLIPPPIVYFVVSPHTIASRAEKTSLSHMLTSNSQALNLYLLSLSKFKSYYVYPLCSTFTVLVTPNNTFNLLTCQMLLFYTTPQLKHLTSKYKLLFIFYPYLLSVNSFETTYLSQRNNSPSVSYSPSYIPLSTTVQPFRNSVTPTHRLQQL